MSTKTTRLRSTKVSKEKLRNLRIKYPTRLMYFEDTNDNTFGGFPLPLALRKFDPDIKVIHKQDGNSVLHAMLINQLVERASYFERLWMSSLSTILS